jgi:hypothetical protein
MKDLMSGVCIRNGEEEFVFEYKTDLSIKEKDIFVMSVCDTIIGSDYHSLLKDLIFDFQIIASFTDINLSEIKDTDDTITWVESFVNETNIVDIVKPNLKYGLLDELKEAIDANIEYRTGIHKNILHEALSDLIKTLESKINGIDTESMMNMAGVLAGMGTELTTDNLVQSYINSGALSDK